MDKDLLLNIFRIGNPSGKEQEMANFIKNHLDANAIPYKEDEMGNIYNLEDKNLPILNAHMDSVQDDTDAKLSKFVKIRGDVLRGYGVIGGDDKCGIYIILDILKRRKVNFLFTMSEEIGCVGINAFMNQTTLTGYPYALTLDRYGSGDIICYDNDYGTKFFEDELERHGRDFGYKSERGVYSDADYISRDVSCANISVGYYSHHTKKEFVVLSELQNSIEFIEHLIDNLKTKFSPPSKAYSYKNNYYGYGKSYYSAKTNYNKIHSYEDYDYNDDYYYGESEYKTCCVKNTRGKGYYFIKSLGKYISKEGAEELINEIEDCGILYDTGSYPMDGYKYDESIDSYYSNDKKGYEDDDDINALLEEIV